MIEVFTLIREITESFNGTIPPSVHSDKVLCRPIRKFTVDFVRYRMRGCQSLATTLFAVQVIQCVGLDVAAEVDSKDIGAHSLISLEELWEKVSEIKTKKRSQRILDGITLALTNLSMAHSRVNSVRSTQHQIQYQRASLEQSEHLLTAHLMVYEEVLAAQPSFTLPTLKNRLFFMHQLSDATQQLTSISTAIQRKRDELMVLTTAISQRLKWAVGANPDLNELMTEFSSNVTVKRDHMDKACLLTAITIKHCLSVMQYEKLRVTTAEAIEDDQRFLDLVSRWEKSCTMAQSCSSMVTPTEEAIVELLDPEGPIDRTWLNNVGSLIDDMTDQLQQEISNSEKEMVNAQDELQTCAYRLRALLATHHRIAGKVLHLLKSFYLFVNAQGKIEVTNRLAKHNAMLNTLAELHGHVLSKDFTEDVVNDSLHQINTVLMDIKENFDELITTSRYSYELGEAKCTIELIPEPIPKPKESGKVQEG